MTSKLRTLLVFLATFLASCQTVKTDAFVDPRFNEVLQSYGPNADAPIKLYPNRIIYGYGSKYFRAIYHDCHLLENKIGYLKYQCNLRQKCDGESVCKGIKKASKSTWDFEILQKTFDGKRWRLRYNDYGNSAGPLWIEIPKDK